MTRLNIIIVLLGVAAAAPACGSDPEEPAAEQVAEAQGEGHQPRKVSTPGDNAGSASLGEPAPSRSQLAAQVTTFLDDWARREKAFVNDYKGGFQSALRRIKWFGKLTRQAYEAREYALLFSDGTRLNEAARAMLGALDGLESHGIPPERFERDKTRLLLEDLAARQQAYNDVLQGVADERESALWSVMDELRGRETVAQREIEALLASRGLSDEDVPRMQALKARLERMFAAKAKLNEAFVQADIRLLQSYFRYAYEMRYARIAHPFDADRSYGAGVERSAEALYARYERTDFGQLQTSLDELVPKIPEYKQMQEGLIFYRELAARGDQVELPASAKRLRPGSKGDTVKALQKRLAQEGYYDGTVTGQYDEATAKGVLLYQETHQLRDKEGAMTRLTRKSMNKPFAERAKEIELGLMRHRESDLHQNPDFVFGISKVQVRVNIPAFEAAWYVDGKRARTHRVVVGSNGTEVDERTGKRGWFNRTRLFSETLKTVILNPKWRVPPRIKEQELDRELMDEPDFYEKNNYKVVIRENGTEEVVQMPGPNNALGLVKFLFPNRFSIYMHDTPKKRLFGREIRAFSHGCMRVDGALDMAKWLLTTFEGMTEKRFDYILDRRETYGVALKTKVPITIDYNTVAVHPETGKMMFFSDVYKYDRDFLAGKTPYPQHPGMEQVVLLR